MSKKFRLDKLKITVSISNCRNFTFYETFKDEHIPHKNFTFLRQGSHEIPGWRYLQL